MGRIIGLFLFCFMVVFGCSKNGQQAPPPPPPSEAVEVHVFGAVEGEDGKALEGVKIAVSFINKRGTEISRVATTDSEGKYEILVETGERTMRATKGGYVPFSEPMIIAKEMKKNITMILSGTATPTPVPSDLPSTTPTPTPNATPTPLP